MAPYLPKFRTRWRGEWLASGPGHFPPEERAPGTHWIGSWVDHRIGLKAVENIRILALERNRTLFPRLSRP
jgi:hypothetical protein